MASVIWSGAALDGNMATAGNYVGGAAPGSGDDVIFDRGSNPVTTWTTLALGTVTFTQGYSGYVGTAGSPVAITLNITTLKIGSKHTGFYLSVPTTKTITTLSAENGVVSITGAGTVTTANISNGCQFTCTATGLTTLNVVTPDSSAIVATSATATTTVNCVGRAEFTSRDITTANVEGSGRLVYKGTSVLGTGNIGTGGIINKQSYSTTDGTVNIKFGGTFTNEGNTYMDNGAGTSTKPKVGTVNIWSGGKFIPNGVGNTLDVTTTAYIGPAGGDRPFDPIG